MNSNGQLEMQRNVATHQLLLKAGAHLFRRGNVELLRLANPGLHLTPEQQRDLIAVFAAETDAIYKADTSHYWNRRPDYLISLKELLTIHLEGSLIGWAGLSLLSDGKEKVLYVDTMNVRTNVPRSTFQLRPALMLAHEVYVAAAFRCWPPNLPCGFRTQNPRVYQLASALTPNAVHPRVVNNPMARKNPRAARAAKVLAKSLSPSKPFDSECSVIRGAYERCLYGKTSPALRTSNASVSEYWSKHLATEDGDALVITVTPTLAENITVIGRYYMAVLKDKARRILSRMQALNAHLY